MNDFKLFAGSSHPVFAEAIAKKLKTKLGKITLNKFSCGENYVKFDETFRGQHTFLIQTCRTGEMNEDLVQLLLMVQAAKLSFAKSVNVVMPYFAYSRQDKIHGPREGISAKLFADMIYTAGADQVMTLHLHSDQTQGFFDCPVDNLNPRNIFVDYFKKKKLKDAVVVSPDAGGAKTAKKFADDLGVGLVILHKQRPAHNVSEVMNIVGDVEGKTPIIVDDMVDTGGSMIGAHEALIKAGSQKDIYLCTTHPVFSGKAYENLEKAGFKEIVCSDSLPVTCAPKNLHVISVAPLFAEVIRNVLEHKSVSKLHL